jgi:glycosyltransferase involved in cell wall biosynthesis
VTTPLHVLFLLDGLFPGGAQRQAVEIGRWLHDAAGLRVTFVVYHEGDFFGPRLAELGIPVLRLQKRQGFDPALVLRLRRVLREQAPDVMHAFLPPACLYGFLASRLIRHRERPSFVSAERSALRGAGSPGLAIERLVYPRSDAVTTNAACVAEEIRTRLHVDPRKVHYIPNGIDLAAWDRQAAQECPFELGPGFHIALVGGLRAEKNHPVLLQALTQLTPAERAGLHVWFIGGEGGARDAAEGIREAIAREGLGEIVRMVPATTGIAAVMRRLDALVLPSAYEGFPNVLLEAMASQLPAIASRVGDVPSMLEEGCTGFGVAPGDAAALAAALRRLRALSPEARRRMGARGRAVVEERYRLDVVGEQLRALYEALHAARIRSLPVRC